MTKITTAKFIKACKGSGGVQAILAQKIGVSRQAINQYINDHPDINKYLELAEEEAVDIGESKLMQNIAAGKERSLLFFLERKGKKRGYGKEIKIEGDNPYNSEIERWKKIIEEIEEEKKEKKEPPSE